MRLSPRGVAQWVLVVVLVFGLGGCAGLSGALRDPDEPPPLLKFSAETEKADEAPLIGAGPETAATAADPAPAEASQETVQTADAGAVQLAQQTGRAPASDDQIEEYDPWEPFNEVTFEFNRGLDRWLIKPAAKAYNFVMPELVQEMISNGFDNIRFVPRMINSLLQGKLAGAGREMGRFLINTTVGFGGLFDPAKKEFGIEKSKEDAGQTLGTWGMGPGPYLVLPFLPPLTVRDGIGFAADMAMDPLGYFVPFLWEGLAMKAGDTVNDRSLNLDLYQGFEETTVEFYSALRNAYLQRRQKLIRE